MSIPEQSVIDRIRLRMPKASFDAPASQAMIDAAQDALGLPFPNWLREIYLACNGF